MTSQIEGTRTGRRAGLFAKLRKLWLILKTVDLEQLYAEFDARQRRIEHAQRLTDALVAETGAKIDLLLHQVRRLDPLTLPTAILDIKNLGYELGRLLAEKDFAGRAVLAAERTRLKSKLCTQDDFASDWLHFWCREMLAAPIYHRKIWELCYVAQALFAEGMLATGRRGIAFGCGEEPLPSLFAKYGAVIIATDLDAPMPEAAVWRQTAQHAGAVEAIRRADICADPGLLANIEFRPVDMNAIPAEFDGKFDFCWSTCALEHLGTLDNGLAFIENSLRTLKPGGVAVHTTEFTVTEGPTIDNHPIVLYQRQHLERLAERLQAAGHQVAEFDFSPGNGILDRFVDLPPFHDNALIGPQHYAHLKLLFDGYTCTSIGIVVRKAGA